MHEKEWKTIEGLVEEACFEMWAALGATAQASAEDVVDAMDDAFVATIGFGGESVRGALTFAAPREVLLRTHPLAAQQIDAPETELLDWCSEISNQLLGRVKNKLLAYETPIFLSTPSAMHGRQVRLHSPTSASCVRLRSYRLDERRVAVGWSGEASRGFALGEPRAAANVAHESEMIEF
jgi:CheY-specific phosphatase CheX